MAAPHNGARRFGARFWHKRKYEKCGNTGCISHFSYCTIGAKDPPKPAVPIVRCCLIIIILQYLPVCGIFNLKESAGGKCRDLSGARQRLSDTTGLYCQRVIRCQRYFRAGHQPVSPGYTKPGAYEVLPVEKQPDGYVIRYTYGTSTATMPSAAAVSLWKTGKW